MSRRHAEDVESTALYYIRPAEDVEFTALKSRRNLRTLKPQLACPVDTLRALNPQLSHPVDTLRTLNPQLSHPVDPLRRLNPQLSIPVEKLKTLNPRLSRPVDTLRTLITQLSNLVDTPRTLNPQLLRAVDSTFSACLRNCGYIIRNEVTELESFGPQEVTGLERYRSIVLHSSKFLRAKALKFRNLIADYVATALNAPYTPLMTIRQQLSGSVGSLSSMLSHFSCPLHSLKIIVLQFSSAIASLGSIEP
ncbi:unnamed protein product [Acanthosepion pharaonis]|uniref:Uncharacterized protein n=1 Tax=Acanthosepion pharaonis TaxID=158019 RepID=A0A812DZK5_ACAPH|nr:unnamed protein product [Sepia pharaonis]